MGNYVNHEVLVNKFTIPEVAGVTFGGFKCDKYINSQPDATAYNGLVNVASSGGVGTVPGISRPGIPVWKFVSLPSAMIACCNKGKGYHLTSVFERASIAFLSQYFGTMPHGDNSNTNPPCDITYNSEIGILDKYEYARSAGAYSMALPGTGPNTWAHNHLASGIYDLNGLVWEWCMGLFMEPITGYARVLASTDVTYTGSPYGRGTISKAGTAPVVTTLTVDGQLVNWNKEWIPDAFNNLEVYIAEAGGMITSLDTTPTAPGSNYVVGDVLSIGSGFGATCQVKSVGTDGNVTSVGLTHGGGGYAVGTGKTTTGGTGTGCTVNILSVNSINGGAFFPIVDTTANTLVLANDISDTNLANGTATFVIVKRVATDITSGMTSGSKILTLRNLDVDLKYFAIPASSDSSGSDVYGKDGYWFNKDTEVDKAAFWGGSFNSGVIAGVFALDLNGAPSYSGYNIGFRACKAL